MQTKLFDKDQTTYRDLIRSIAIIGYNEKDINERGENKENKENLNFECLFILPKKESEAYNSLVYSLMFPDNNHEVKSAKYFTLTLTDEYGAHIYLYNLKFSENYKLKSGETIKIPIIISIRSPKEDYEPFKGLLYVINQLIVQDEFLLNKIKGERDSNCVNNYKKIELLNLFLFSLSLIKSSPHSLIKLNLNDSLTEGINSSDDLDFYFSSNCEIPCNKNDTDINMLFLILDQSIIVKLILNLLTEKQIVIRASYASVLYLIFPALLKLIFPFQWIHSYLPVVPGEQLELLEKPGSYLFGVLASDISLDSLLKDYPGIVIVDCDTNEIFDKEIYYAPIKGDQIECLSQGSNLVRVEKDQIFLVKEKKEKKENKEKEKDNKESKEPKEELISIKSNNIEKGYLYIDCDNDDECDIVYIDKSGSYLTPDEWKRINRKIQLIKNPDIFSTDIIDKSKSKSKTNSNTINSILDDDDDLESNFSTNIQKVFLDLLKEKMSSSDSEFMESFKDTNLYRIFLEPKTYQNDSGKRILNNIDKTVNNRRSIANSFIINYQFQKFPSNNLIQKIEKSENDKENDEKILAILNDYKTIKETIIKSEGIDYDENEENEEDDYENNGGGINEMKEHIPNLKESQNKNGPKTPFGNLIKKNSTTKIIDKSHLQSNSILNESLANKIFLSYNNTETNKKFTFYGNNGFLYFLDEFFTYCEKKEINLNSFVYEDKLIFEIINIIYRSSHILKIIDEIVEKDTDNNLNLENNNEEDNKGNINEGVKDNNNSQKSKNVKIKNIKNTSIKTPQALADTTNDKTIISQLLEEGKEEGKEKDNEVNDTNSVKVNEQKENQENYVEDDFGNSVRVSNSSDMGNESQIIGDELLLSSVNPIIQFEHLESLNDNSNLNSNQNTFTIFESKESVASISTNKTTPQKNPFNNKENEKENLKENDIKLYELKDHFLQYYVFIASYLERIKSNKSSLETFTSNFNRNIDINQLIHILYEEAFKCTNKEEFPFFQYYTFLMGLTYEEINKINKSKGTKLEDLENIYNKVQYKKQKDYDKKHKRSNSKNLEVNNTEMRHVKGGKGLLESQTFKVDINEEDLLTQTEITTKKHNDDLDIDLNLNMKKNKNRLPIERKKSHIKVEFSNKIVINNAKEFEPQVKNATCNIIKELSQLIMLIFPSEEDIKKNSSENLLEMSNEKAKISSIIELVSELKCISLSKIKRVKQRISFWINCFNYLILFTIFYKKWNVSCESDWRKFFKNVYYNIGGKEFSFNDMQYMIFNKIIFFNVSTYKAEKYVKDLSVLAASRNEENEAENNSLKSLSYFSLFLPTKELLMPQLIEEEDCDNFMESRNKKYFLSFVKKNEMNCLCIPEFVLMVEKGFLGKGALKYENCLDGDILNIIIKKRYKEVIKKKISWRLDFSYLWKEIDIKCDDNI